jgi:phosphomannomutase
MKNEIRFGTDGWRGVIGEDFTFSNVRKVAAAIAEYIRQENEPRRGLVIGFDTRFLSRESAHVAAEIVASAGIPVTLAQDATSTPALSYAAVQRQTAGAIVVTASHNPYRWNGIKFKADYGGSALPAIMRRIEVHLSKLTPGRRAIGRRAALIEEADLISPYLERLKSLVSLQRIRAAGQRFVVDPMYGAGRGCLRRLFEEQGIACREIHPEHNPLFPGLNPEPIEPHVADLRRAVMEGNFDAGMATDGDGDRLGAVDARGAFIDSHKIFSILLKHLICSRKRTGEVVKTFSTTEMIRRLCAKYGLPLNETPIGFKYICQLMLERKILIGGEESGGIAVEGHLPERDGILNALLLAEVMAERKMTLGELSRELEEEFGPHYYGRVDLEIEKAAARRVVRRAARREIKKVAGIPVKAIEDLDGVKLRLGDSAWLLVRASGTENVLRLYAEAPTPELLRQLLDELTDFARQSAAAS